MNTGELNVLPLATPVGMPSYAREWTIASWQQATMLDAHDEPLKEACVASALQLGATADGLKR